MGSDTRDWLVSVAGWGSCPALVFAIVGYFFVRAAIDLKPRKAVSVDGALRSVGEQPDGSWLLAVDPARLILLAIYSFAEARYQRL